LKTDRLLWRGCWLLLLLLTGARISFAQQFSLVQSLAIGQPQAVSIDRLGQVYVSDQKNNLYKFSPQGQRLFTFSPAQQGRLAFVEAWNPVKTLLFYDDRQQIVLLDRFLTPITSLRLADLTDGLIRLATLAQDDQFWILNETELRLDKIDFRYPDSRLSTRLNQLLDPARHDFRLLREYQNHLYLLDRNSGIYIFDNMGNYKKKLPIKGLAYLGFKGDEAYYLKNGQLVFLNLYTLQQRAFPLPAAKAYQLVLVGDKTVHLFSATHLDVYRFE
jgi:hypothetical protein